MPTSPAHACLCSRLFFIAAAALVCGALKVGAQTTGAPVLLTESGSTRAVALESVSRLREPFPLVSPSFVGPDRRTRVLLFATNVDLYAGEGANAFTAEAEDSERRAHPLTVEHVARVPGFQGLTQITLRLNEQMGDAGDVLVRVSLRGMASNRVRLAVGHTGGGPPDDPDMAPHPAPETPPPPRPLLSPDPYTGPADARDAVRLLEQATWGPTQAEAARVQAMGLRAFLDEQFALPATGYPTLPLVPVDGNQFCQGAGRDACIRDNYTMYPLQTRFFKNALYGRDQLRQRVAFALHQILVISGRDMNQTSAMVPYLQALDRHAFGNYRRLLAEVTLTPAMGEFLDVAGNHKDRPNENFAREFLQLFTVGPDILNPDGTPRLDAEGRRVPTYDQATITDFARVFTGWNFALPPPGSQGILNYIDPLAPGEREHDAGAKTLLGGAGVPPGLTARQDLEAAVDNAFNHPNTPPFVAKRLIRHLVTSNPSPAYVERVAAVFANNCRGLYPEQSCTGERGDLKGTVRALLLDPEARGPSKTDPDYGRLREPALYVLSLLRAFDAKGVGPGINNFVESDGNLNPHTTRMGQDVFRPATVFGYFPADYVVPGLNLAGPEFGTLSSTTALQRVGFVAQMVYHGGISRGSTPDTPNGTFVNLVPFVQLAPDPAKLLAALDALFLHGTMTAATRAAVASALEAITAADPNQARNRTHGAVYLVLTSPQYQVQR